jgi:hypothetical protein
MTGPRLPSKPSAFGENYDLFLDLLPNLPSSSYWYLREEGKRLARSSVHMQAYSPPPQSQVSKASMFVARRTSLSRGAFRAQPRRIVGSMHIHTTFSMCVPLLAACAFAHHHSTGLNLWSLQVLHCGLDGVSRAVAECALAAYPC